MSSEITIIQAGSRTSGCAAFALFEALKRELGLTRAARRGGGGFPCCYSPHFYCLMFVCCLCNHQSTGTRRKGVPRKKRNNFCYITCTTSTGGSNFCSPVGCWLFVGVGPDTSFTFYTMFSMPCSMLPYVIIPY